MEIVVWLVEGTWPAAVDATRAVAGADDEVVLLYVEPGEVSEAAAGAFAGLLGRSTRRDPSARLAERVGAAGGELLDAAAARLGRPARRVVRRGRIEREVVDAAAGAGLLVVARDGTRPGPHSLAPPTRFVVDHVSCPLLLVGPRNCRRGVVR